MSIFAPRTSGLLMRTCVVTPPRVQESGSFGAKMGGGGLGLLTRTCEVWDSRYEEEEEEYMDSEEEQELIGCKVSL